MNLRTTFSVDPSGKKISYSTQVMFLGSCFASEIGERMAAGKMRSKINPAGTVYNPVSVASALDLIMSNRKIRIDDLIKFKNLYLSFLHDTEFSGEDPVRLLDNINNATEQANHFLRNAGFLFVTFGTARVFRFSKTGEIVSNCHKIPSTEFSRELLTVEGITETWTDILDRLCEFNRDLKVIFTISPVRHWKDGAHGNQVSKSVLFIAVEKLLSHSFAGGYFPAYEFLMDDLRDYRFYADDMLHPSDVAVDYIWKAFADCYLEKEVTDIYQDVISVKKAMGHRFLSDSSAARNEFAGKLLKKISAIENKCGSIDFTAEKEWFNSIILNSQG